jgi:hypothetical protein
VRHVIYPGCHVGAWKTKSTAFQFDASNRRSEAGMGSLWAVSTKYSVLWLSAPYCFVFKGLLSLSLCTGNCTAASGNPLLIQEAIGPDPSMST